MDSLTIFGLLAVTLMLVFYALESRMQPPCAATASSPAQYAWQDRNRIVAGLAGFIL